MAARIVVATLVVLSCGIGFGRAQAQGVAQPIKVYIEAPDVMAASDALRAKCGDCTVILKKEGADFLLMIGKNAAGAFRFGVFENAKGELVKEGEAASLEEAIGPAFEAMSAKAAEPKAAARVAGGKTRVHIYRYKDFATSGVHPSVFCDQMHIADLQDGRYFIVEVDAGKHAFRANDKQAVIELNTEPGKEYFLRVEMIQNGLWKPTGRLMMVMPEQGAPEVKRLRYLDADDIKDKKMVKPPEPVR
jgi:hypothetical protein